MRFRFSLSHPESGNSLEVSEMIGWKDAVIRMERHPDFRSLVEYFDGSFILYGDNGEKNGGITFVKAIERDYGVDATLLVDIDFTRDEESFTNVFNGQYKIADLEEMPNNKMRIPIIRDDFWAKFISRLDTPVDLKSTTNLDDELCVPAQEVNFKLSSQIIEMTYQADNTRLSDPDFVHRLGNTDLPIDNGTYFQVDWNNDILDEIEEKFSLPIDVNPDLPVWLFGLKYGGNLRIEITIYAYSSSSPVSILPVELGGLPFIDFFVRVGNTTEYQFAYSTEFWNGVDSSDGEASKYTLNITVPVDALEQIRIYGRANDDFSGATVGWLASTFVNKSTARIVLESTYPKSNCSGFLIHDIAAAICDRITGETDSFYSELLGSPHTTARQYEEFGCASNYGATRGLQIRQYTLAEKPISMSFKQWWAGVDPIIPLSLRYDTIEGGQKIVVGRLEDEFDYSDGVSVNFSYVRDIVRKYDPDLLFNKIEAGYARWQSENVSGIDDPQTKKTYATRFKKVGKTLTFYSEFIGASLAWETTRRETKIKSADYKFDNETFILALNPELQTESPDVSPDLLQFAPEFDENFNSVSNLLHADTRYNLRITPARNFLRRKKFIQGGLQDYISSPIKFVSGEGNYDMVSEMIEFSPDCLQEDFNGDALDEKGDLFVDADYLHLAMSYEMEIPMEWEEYESIRDLRRKPIGISQTDENHVPMFIKDIQYKPAKGSCTIIAWPREYMELFVIEDIASTTLCYVQNECDGGITDDLGEFLTDELGVCITE